MFCPRCGSNQNDELKFCKSCGTNLHAIRQIVDNRESVEKFDWSRTWVAEMFLSEAEKKRRKEELERQRGITPEVKRYNEIKAGVITSSVGLAVAIVLFFLMQGIILSGRVEPDAAEIISRIWIAGVIPLFVGIALIINGLFVSKKMVEVLKQGQPAESTIPRRDAEALTLRPADTSEFLPSGFSVTEQTTRHLRDAGQNE